MLLKQKIVAVCLSLIMFGMAIPVVQAKPGKDLQMIAIIVNGHKIKFPDTEPYINTDGRTMVPVRFVSEKLGADVKWEEKTQSVILKYEEKEIRMGIGSKEVSVNGEALTLDTAAEKHEGRTMVPLRFVSEVLDSKVEWDEGAHSVRVTDAEYQAKIDTGKVALDPWGREYSKTWNKKWMVLSDLENTKFYSSLEMLNTDNRDFVKNKVYYDFKMFGDKWGEHIRKYYAAQLNIDYRTINEKEFINTYIKHHSLGSSYDEGVAREMLKNYVAWVKKNKVIAKGYASPELSQVTSGSDARIIIRTNFKFMIISAEDTRQTFLDNWNNSFAFDLKKNVWYDGYSDVLMVTNYANEQHRFYQISGSRQMFDAFSVYDIAS